MKRKLIVLALGIVVNLSFGCDLKDVAAFKSYQEFLSGIGRVEEWPVYLPPVHEWPQVGSEYTWAASEG